MKKQLVTLLIIFSIILSFSIPVGATTERKSVIVVFNGAPDAGLIRAHGGDIKYQYDIIPGIAVNMPVTALKGLQNHPNIAYIEDDIQVVYAQVEILPWGVDRIDADKVWGSDGNTQTVTGANTGEGVNIAVLDTGIDADHPDLYANVKGGINFITTHPRKPADPTKWDDDNGHGTHVAGTIAAMDNDIGVIGVAPDASLYGVKVLDRYGSGSLSGVIAGIDWAKENDMDIITMSLSTSTDVSALEDACDNAYAADVVIVAAAGNGDGDDPVNYPAAYDSVIAVSATNDDNSLASYSNVGPQVELSAPGTNVLSTYKGGIYGTTSGTSMATPHVTGVAALVIASDTNYWDNPVAVRAQLTLTAEDLGTAGRDPSFGYGLIDAENATPPATTTPDTNPPVISYVTTSDITDTSATITWTTDEASDSVVNYGTSSMALGTIESDSAMVSSVHSVTLKELTPETIYHYEVKSTDFSGNSATDNNGGNYYTFTTTSDTPPTGNEMHIASIDMSTVTKPAGRNDFTWATATVTVEDSIGILEGAQVIGIWSDLTSDTDEGITESDGTVTLRSDSEKNLDSGTFTFTVTGVYLAGWTYNPSANAEDYQGSITVPE